MTISRNTTIEQYHDNGLISHSMLRDFAEKGACYYYRRYIEKTIPRKTSDAFTFGQAFETLVQRPLDFNREVIVAPEGLDGRTKEGKAFKASCNGREFISHFEYRQMERMLEAYREHTIAGTMVKACEAQLTLTHDNLQARPDWACLEGTAETSFRPISIDLKTCDDMSELKNSRKILKYGYHTQAAMVRRLLAANGHPGAACYLLCVEKETPHRVAMFELDSELLDDADRWINTQLAQLARCYETNTWPRVEPGIIRIGKPAWLQTEEAA